MATTYTSVLRLAKPTSGELSGTWGDVVNDNVTTMIEQAITGKATVAMADADQTLTTANGSTDQARCMMVECTGAGMSTARNVICPTATKLYIVNNLANKSVVFKTTGGTGITISSSTCNIVYCDGTNVVGAFTAAVPLAAVAGTVTVVDAAGDTTTYPMLASDATGNLGPMTDPGLTYNATTNALTATTFVGALTGRASGNATVGQAIAMALVFGG